MSITVKRINSLLNVVIKKVTVLFTSLIRGLHIDVVYLGWPIAPSYMSSNSGGGGELRGAGDLTPYLTMPPIEGIVVDRHWPAVNELKFRGWNQNLSYPLPPTHENACCANLTNNLNYRLVDSWHSSIFMNERRFEFWVSCVSQYNLKVCQLFFNKILSFPIKFWAYATYVSF